MAKRAVNTSGKRKTAIARCTTTEGTGRVTVNKVPLEVIEPELVRLKMMEPFMFVEEEFTKTFDMKIRVRGGGFMAQANAVRIAIARALVAWTESSELKDTFIQYERHMLVGDSRRKEQKKFGGPGARAKYTKSYR